MPLDPLSEKIRTVLIADWDPIGVRDVAAARDEYDQYVASVAVLVRAGRTASDLSKYLLEIETETMGLPGDRVRALSVGRKVLSAVSS